MNIDRLIYDPDRLHCTAAEKEAALETLAKLARLWGVLRREGVLAVLQEAENEENPFFRACLRELAEGYDPPALQRLFAAYLAAENARGGAFLEAALIAKGLLLLSEQLDCDPDLSAAAWGALLSRELRGFFGAEYRERVIAVVERETRRSSRRAVSVVPAFDALARLPLAQRQALLERADVRDLAIALQGAAAETETALLEALTEPEREQIRQKRPFLTNLRESDVREAQIAVLAPPEA